MWNSSELSKCEVTPSSSEDGSPSGARRALPLRSLRDSCCWVAAGGLQRTRGPHHVFITQQYFLLLPCGVPSHFHFSSPNLSCRRLRPARPHLNPGPHPWPLVAPSMCPATGSSLTHECGQGENGPAEGLDANRRQQDLQFKPADRPYTSTPRRHTHQCPRHTPSQHPVIGDDWRRAYMDGETHIARRCEHTVHISSSHPFLWLFFYCGHFAVKWHIVEDQTMSYDHMKGKR